MTLATLKMGIPKPVGSENATRVSITTMIDKIDEQASQEPFLVVFTTLLYAAGNLTIPVGPGKARFSTTFVNKAAENVVIPSPAVSTTYYLYLKSDGTYAYNTTGIQIAGQRVLWSFLTGNPVSAGTVVMTDLREQMPNTDVFVPTGVTAGTYGSASLIPIISVDQYGRLTLVTTAAPTPATGSVTSAMLANTAVTPAAYGDAANVATFTVDAKGRLTAAANVAIVVQTANIAANAVTPTKVAAGTYAINVTGNLTGNVTGNVSGTAGSAPPTGAAGGSLTGSSYPNPIVGAGQITAGMIAAGAVPTTALDLSSLTDLYISGGVYIVHNAYIGEALQLQTGHLEVSLSYVSIGGGGDNSTSLRVVSSTLTGAVEYGLNIVPNFINATTSAAVIAATLRKTTGTLATGYSIFVPTADITGATVTLLYGVYIAQQPHTVGGAALRIEANLGPSDYSFYCGGRARFLGNNEFANTSRVGFYGTAPIDQPVFATGASHTVDQLITLLQSYGLCRQS